jgi:beta-lactam-binding protein with PASTA domain
VTKTFGVLLIGLLSASRVLADSSTHVVVPDIMGLSRTDAIAKLRAAGVRGDIDSGGDEMYDFSVAKVCGLSPGVGEGTLSTLSISVTYCPVRAEAPIDGPPELRGVSLEEAIKRIKTTKFHGKVKITETTRYQPGYVVDTVCAVDAGMGWWANKGPLALEVYRKPKITTKK